jgi:uncharacterized iron-regulated membrane protein
MWELDRDVVRGLLSAALFASLAMGLYQFWPDLKNGYFVGGMFIAGLFLPSIVSAVREYWQDRKEEGMMVIGTPRCRTRHINWHDVYGTILILIVLVVAFFYPWFRKFLFGG